MPAAVGFHVVSAQEGNRQGDIGEDNQAGVGRAREEDGPVLYPDRRALTPDTESDERREYTEQSGEAKTLPSNTDIQSPDPSVRRFQLDVAYGPLDRPGRHETDHERQLQRSLVHVDGQQRSHQ
jgi:hypothetical protein